MTKYDIDYNYKFEMSENGFPLLPKGMTKKDGLFVLPNGKYLPDGVYSDGKCDIIYEPYEFSIFAKLLEKQPNIK